MFSTLIALCLFTGSADAAWNWDLDYAVSLGVDQDGVTAGYSSSVAHSPFEQGPQLALKTHSALNSPERTHRFGLGLRQELNPTLALSAHALFVSRDSSDRLGLEGTLSWRLWRNGDAPYTEPTMGLGLYAYGGATPAAESVSGDRWWWTGTGLMLSFGR
ncbi:MAG: hypothetical protein QGG40_18885 [Myxococcota bacterium]|nr:hypothetical protein [Myxococcota bacterium]